MEIFNPNGPLYKVMWAADGANIIWNMQQEESDVHCDALTQLLRSYIDVDTWAKSYENYYHQWLHEDDLTIFAPDSLLLVSTLNAIKHFNKQEPSSLYYWFDVSRTDQQGFQWQYSPLSSEALRELPPKFHRSNRYITLHDLLFFQQIA